MKYVQSIQIPPLLFASDDGNAALPARILSGTGLHQNSLEQRQYWVSVKPAPYVAIKPVLVT